MAGEALGNIETLWINLVRLQFGVYVVEVVDLPFLSFQFLFLSLLTQRTEMTFWLSVVNKGSPGLTLGNLG